MKKISPEPAIIVIFGVTGDLVRRKLFPALANLLKRDLVHKDTVILGVTRQDISSDQLLDSLVSHNSDISKEDIERIRDRLIIQTMDVTKGDDYARLLTTLNGIEEIHGLCMNRLYYLSIPPQVLGPIVSFLGQHGLNKSCQHGNASTRLLIEKPFGYDLSSAKELISETSKYFSEDQVYRIDHYLAKETVQNILNFRFNNAIFEPLWNNKYISRIDITATEKIGIEGRSVFYEEVGALRDLIQSHLLQLLAIVTMNEPANMSSDGIHAARLELLQSIESISSVDVEQDSVRAQYMTYKKEVSNQASNTETFAAIKVKIDSPIWKNVPIIIKTGKALNEKLTSVRVTFKRNDNPSAKYNALTFRIQPNEGIDLTLCVKRPGLENDMELVEMDFSYERFFKENQPDAYVRVLADAIKGDHTLFASGSEVIEAWRIIENVLKNWNQSGYGLLVYGNNSKGPLSATKWLDPNLDLEES